MDRTVHPPGQPNLMMAGRGIAHAEADPDGSGGDVHGMQLRVARTSATLQLAATPATPDWSSISAVAPPCLPTMLPT